jgi:Arc/MetJ family transcription regulator
MKLSELKSVVKDAVREAIQEELKDILLEAIKSPKQVVTEHASL